MENIASALDLRLSVSDLESLADSLPDWPVFPEANGALAQLKNRYKLAVISNVDDDMFASSAEMLGVDFDAIVTSQQVRSYKPDLRNFNTASERMAVDRGKVAAYRGESVSQHWSSEPPWHRFCLGKPRGPGRRDTVNRCRTLPGRSQSRHAGDDGLSVVIKDSTILYIHVAVSTVPEFFCRVETTARRSESERE